MPKGTKEVCHSHCLIRQIPSLTLRKLLMWTGVCGLKTLIWQWLNWQFLNHRKRNCCRCDCPCVCQVQIMLHGFQDTRGVTCNPVISQMHKNTFVTYTLGLLNSFLIWMSMHDSLLCCFWTADWKVACKIAILLHPYCWQNQAMLRELVFWFLFVRP